MLAYRLVSNQLVPIPISGASFDEVTRQLPRGLYSTFITNHGGTRVLGLTAHLDRLFVPAEERGPSPSASRADLRRALASLATSSPPAESRFRILRTDSDGIVYVMVQPFIPPPKEIYQRGVKVITAELTRHDPRRKDTGFINESEPMRAKVDGDVYEALLTKQGKIYEGMTSNFYAVVYPFVVSEAKQSPPPQKRLLRRDEHPPRNDGILMTARFGILLGVTRRAILRLARGQGLGIQYRPPRLDEDFAEAFLTSSSRGVVPIVQIDGRPVGEGGPGQWTKLLVKAYAAYVDERSEVILPAILVV